MLDNAKEQQVQIGQLTIRKADWQDLDTLVAFSRMAHEESVFGYIPFSEEKVRAFGDKAFSNHHPHVIVLVAEKKGELLGHLYATTGEHHVGIGTLLTSVHSLYVPKTIRHTLLGGKVALRLVGAAKKWSEHVGAKHLLFHVASGDRPAETDRFMRKMGMKTLGGNYVG